MSEKAVKAKALLDKHLERFISRKFLAWLTATGLCSYGMVTSDNWTAITLGYIGTQAIVDLATQWKKGDTLQSQVIRMRRKAKKFVEETGEDWDVADQDVDMD